MVSARIICVTEYAELMVASNYSFLRGASHPEELVATAAMLGIRALAITDRDSVSGIVRAHTAAKAAGLHFIPAARLDLMDGLSLAIYPTTLDAYGRLCQLLSIGKQRAAKGECHLWLNDVLADGVHADWRVIIVPPALLDDAFHQIMTRIVETLPRRVYLAGQFLYLGDDNRRLAALHELGETTGMPMVAVNDVHAHTPARRPLQDVLGCIRAGCTIHEAGYRLHANGERYLKSPDEMVRLFHGYQDAIHRTAEIAEACTFSLDELRYVYPTDPLPNGRTPQAELEHLTDLGARNRYPDGVPDKVCIQIDHELSLIAGLRYAPYFLSVYDLVDFANKRGILCQGRGSAANSAVCYCLGITAVDPARIDLLFERFVSAERDEPPDIDVDFESGRREEVIQHVYEKYGRERSGMTATVITYRTKSALREVGKVLGLSEDTITALQKVFWRRGWDEVTDDNINEVGLDPASHDIRLLLKLAGELRGFPRHLSQHTGGMVMTQGPLTAMVPIANAAMEDRTVIEWDKNDLDALGILKVDILGLGMLTCIEKCFQLISEHYDRDLSLATIPPEDPDVYEMLCRADSVGVFQVESRAQMSMLPRLKPRCFYDLVIEVAIVRPGPIQGDMVHPYLRRRDGTETVNYPSAALEHVLGKTLGIPLFQEQAMKIAIVGAGFSPAEADALRRALATFKRFGDVHKFRERFVAGMLGNGYAQDFAERCFRQIEGFADYGFPESHAASFALLVYVSSWLKHHYPAAFACGLLNSQPMGFYAPAQIVRDARDHGVTVRPPDVNHSHWDCTLEEDGAVLRLGFRQIKGLAEMDVDTLLAARPVHQVSDLWHHGVSRAVLEKLARADTFTSLGIDRRGALWEVRALSSAPPVPLLKYPTSLPGDAPVQLPLMGLGEHVADDYRTMRLSLKSHPMALLRPQLAQDGYGLCGDLDHVTDGKAVQVAGLVITRQRPGSAKGVMFVTLEDETGNANLVVWNTVYETCRNVALGSVLMGVSGTLQREGRVIHVVAKELMDESNRLASLDAPDTLHVPLDIKSRNFH
jgi:error-prone DNA polymerase